MEQLTIIVGTHSTDYVENEVTVNIIHTVVIAHDAEEAQTLMEMYVQEFGYDVICPELYNGKVILDLNSDE